MKYKNKYWLAFSVFINPFVAMLTIAQTNWTTENLFEQQNFVENNGQFNNIKLPNNEDVLYAAYIDGVTYYFTKQGYTISRSHLEKRNEMEMEPVKKKYGIIGKRKKAKEMEKEKEEKEMQYKIEEQFHELIWKGANPNAEIIAEHRVKNYYSCSGPDNAGKPTTIIAHAYTQLTYKNIYSNTDIVFEFPKDSTGIKYSIYLHPGADVEKVRMSFPNKKIAVDNQQNLVISSDFGNIIDHAPNSYTQTTAVSINSRFKITNNEIGIELMNAPTDQTIIIDPWTTTPVFGTSNSAYDIDYDNQGNVYVYGGIQATGPFILLKYNSGGTLIWSHNTSSFTFPSYFYGDFAIDRSSNNIYLIEGFNPAEGANVIKINSDATILATFGGDLQFWEMWRIAFSACTHQAIIVGGGLSSPTYQTCNLDTNLVSLTPVSYTTGGLPAGNDVGSLALDNNGNCFQMTNSNSDGMYDNQLIKLPIPALFPPSYTVNTGYSFNEGASVLYYGGGGMANESNGYNGLTVSGKNVYSYDSYVLKKWDASTGNLLTYKRINYPQYEDSSQIYWGGISVDDCGNLFLADSNQVVQYDSSLTLVNSYSMPGIITDVNFSGSTEILYVCGLGFASSITPTDIKDCSALLHAAVTTTNVICTEPGSATVNITGGTPPYSITWNTSPAQYGTHATYLSKGTYTVEIVDSSCERATVTKTFAIAESPVVDFKSLPTVNVFSPNNDGKNDLFFPYEKTAIQTNADFIETYHLSIYDRWGNQVFESTQPILGWNGNNKKDKNADEGTYYWVIKLKTNCSEEEIVKTGFVELVR